MLARPVGILSGNLHRNLPTVPTQDYIFPLLLIVCGVIVFAVCALKILGESKQRANEWLEQQIREDPYFQPRRNGVRNR